MVYAEHIKEFIVHIFMFVMLTSNTSILKRCFLVVCILTTLNVMTAQPSSRPVPPNKLTVVGQIIEGQNNMPLEFATISIYNKDNNNIIEGTLSDSEGKFEIKLKKGNYYLKAEFISFESVTIDPIQFNQEKKLDLGQIILNTSSQVLEDIEITAEKSETIFALDKKVFNVGKDLANRGGSAEDILDNVPSVTVDIDGNVSLRGSEGVRILIDGRPSGLAGVGNANGLRSIAANMIEKVEVITNPSARYEAEGMAGIINIILKKNQAGGFNGSFDVNTGYPLRGGLTSNLNYRKGKINWFANYGLNYRENLGGGTMIQDQLTTIDNETLRQVSFVDRDMNRTGLTNSVRLGLDYFLKEKEQITAAFLYRRSDENNTGLVIFEDYLDDPTGFDVDPLWETQQESQKALNFNNFKNNAQSNNLYNVTNRTDDESEDEKNLEYSLNYRKTYSSREHTLNASVQFTERSEIESSDLRSLFQDNLPGTQEDIVQNSSNDESQKTWLFQMDYIHPLGKDHKFETGLRSSFRDIRNDYVVQELVNGQFQNIAAFTNNFLYDENIHAAYVIYGNAFKKFSYQFGLRGEYSFINTTLEQENIQNKRDYPNLFPSGFLNYNFSEKSALQVSYSRRVRRPRFWDLNPFFTFADNRNFFSGNPNIDPEFTDSYEIGQIQYFENLSINSSLFYRKTNASIQRVLIIDLNDITTLRTPLNVGTTHDYGLDISFNYSGLKWLKVDANWNIFVNQLKLNGTETNAAIFDYYVTTRNFSGSQSEFEDQFNFSLNEFETVTWNGRITMKFDFWDSDLQLRTNYRAPRQNAQGRSQGIASVDIGWSKDFLKAKNLTLTLSLRDLFNSRRRNGITLLDDYYQQNNFQWRGRTSTLTASYRINQKKPRGGQRGQRNSEGGGEF